MNSFGKPQLEYFGHASFKLKSAAGAVCYVDPFANGDYSEPADLVLITHEHFDHNQIDLVELGPGASVLRAANMSSTLDGAHLYGQALVGPFAVHAAPAYNSNHPADKCVGYVVRVDGISIYFAGDTSKTEAMGTDLRRMFLNYAFLPSDGIYNMGIEEAGECARALRAKHVAAIHTVGVSSPDSVAFDAEKAAALDAPGAFVFEPGTVIELQRS
ncbi:MAG: MBL fold metallo-hydrolase [Coriobacteriales bacterium]|nr:MBL fold metallo-hydrolase [Coriobacteriales bacterium]